MKLENYELVDKLGEGAFGEVWLTTKKDSPKKFATKKLDREEIERTIRMQLLDGKQT